MTQPTITSAAAFFRAAEGRTVTKTVTGATTLEAWPAKLLELQTECDNNGIPHKLDDDGTFRFGPGFARFIMQPKLRAFERGRLNIRSADYAFIAEGSVRGVFGDKKGATVDQGELVKSYPNGMTVRFAIADQELAA